MPNDILNWQLVQWRVSKKKIHKPKSSSLVQSPEWQDEVIEDTFGEYVKKLVEKFDKWEQLKKEVEDIMIKAGNLEKWRGLEKDVHSLKVNQCEILKNMKNIVAYYKD